MRLNTEDRLMVITWELFARSPEQVKFSLLKNLWQLPQLPSTASFSSRLWEEGGVF